MASHFAFFFHITLLLLILSAFLHTGSSSSSQPQVELNTSSLLVPIDGEMSRMVLNETRRKLSNFQICALCTCCGGDRRICFPSPCCYTINCNIPNRPFGFCSFIPKSCNCFGCHL